MPPPQAASQADGRPRPWNALGEDSSIRGIIGIGLRRSGAEIFEPIQILLDLIQRHPEIERGLHCLFLFQKSISVLKEQLCNFMSHDLPLASNI